MHHRYGHINIPIEVIRTIVAIADTSSFSKAGERLHLSQPAISAQVKRLQNLVGGKVFERAPGGVVCTQLGQLVLSQARKLLEANDQIMLLGGTENESPPMRLGVSSFYINEYFAISADYAVEDRLNVYCAHSVELAKALREGYLDLAVVLSPPTGKLVPEWQEEFVWVRHRNFVLSPGAPVPLVCWPSGRAEQPMIQAMESKDMAYRVAFTSAEHASRIAATVAGIGLMALPERQVSEPLVVAKEYYLPPMPPMRAGICTRPGLSESRFEPIVERLRQLAPARQSAAATMVRHKQVPDQRPEPRAGRMGSQREA